MRRVVAVVGPTAAGKTRLALELAEALNGEVVNLDAFAVYRGMDIGTAKPSAAERAAAPHHLVDIFDISHESTVVEVESLAALAIEDIQGRDRVPVCVGGSGMYVRAVLDVLEVPPTDVAVRAKYQSLLEKVGAEALHQRLAAVDPAAAAQILPGNSRRVVRALEVVELTGSFNARLPEPEPRYDDVRIGLRVPRDLLAARIEQRVREMFAAGWVEEVRSLVARGLLETRTASKAIGYRQVAAVAAGELGVEQAVAEISAATLKFSKRQLQWFQRDRRVQWLDFDDPALAERALALAAG